MDDLTVRVATGDDLDAVAALTRAKRHRLAEWSPTWWRVADGADDLHPLWLGHLISSDGPVARVVVDGAGTVVGCAISVPQGDGWFVDDVAGTFPLDAVPERPALTCVPTLDDEGAAAATGAGLALVSSYWIGPPLPAGRGRRTGRPSDRATTSAPHTFGLAGGPLVDDVRGLASVPPPPVYGAGGTVTIVTAVDGADRAGALSTARAAAAARGDVLVCVVVGVDDPDLAAHATAAGLTRTVEVWSWT